MRAPRVLFVSKPIAPPWNDGSKNLVRDVASHLQHARATVLATPSAPDLGPRVVLERVYRDAGRFAPALSANARVALRLLVGDAHDVWHFVFAPNPLSSRVAQAARFARRATGWRGRVVQTVASAPRTFEGVTRWIFGDVVVALSEHTRGRLEAAGVAAERLHVVPPCALAPRVLGDDDKRAARARFGLGNGPIVLYPGDYEVSRGARTVERAVGEIVRAAPDATVVYACRAKTPRAAEARAEVERELEREGLARHVRHLGEVRDMAEVLGLASVVVFPVDDLYGKVDLPLVLLEAMALGLPLVLARRGPLEALDFARFCEPGDAAALAAHVRHVLADDRAARELGARGREAYAQRYTPEIVAGAYEALYSRLGA